MQMKYYIFSLSTPINYIFTGKFQAPSPEWIHISRCLQEYELIVVTEGTVYIQDDQQEYIIEKGEFRLFPPSSKQSGYRNSNCSFYWVHFSDEYQGSITSLDEYQEDLLEDKICIPDHGKIDNLEKIIVMMKHLQDCVRSYHNKLQNNYMSSTILCEIANQFIQQKDQESTVLKKKQLFNDIKDYIKWNRNSDIKVCQIAEYFGYNKRYISYLFSTIAGITLKQYIMQEKIELAKFLLCDTNDNISEVADQLGFNDNHNFMKAFKKIVGLTPTQYRNAYASRMLFYK